MNQLPENSVTPFSAENNCKGLIFVIFRVLLIQLSKGTEEGGRSRDCRKVNGLVQVHLSPKIQNRLVEYCSPNPWGLQQWVLFQKLDCTSAIVRQKDREEASFSNQ